MTIKRIFDILFSAILLMFLSPLLLVLSVLVRIFLGEPIIFKQKRPGKNGKIFTMYKYRSMSDKRRIDGTLLPDNERMTSFGRFLRKTSLDELPELINILKGDMSFVGPRPQLVKDLVFFSEEQIKRQHLMPGLTGWAQVNGRNSIAWEDKLSLDLEYFKTHSVLLDIKILFMTVFKVLKSEGVQSEGMETAEDYGDYLLRTGKITKDEYDLKIELANKLLNGEVEMKL